MNTELQDTGRATTSSAKLLSTLGVAGALAGMLIVVVFQKTEPTIRAYKAEMLRLAIHEVLQEPDRFDTLYVVDGMLTAERPETGNFDALEQLFVGYRGDDLVGLAMVGAKPGFQDIVRLIFGYDPETEALLGMTVLENKETPGLGDKIVKDSAFVGQFEGVVSPVVGVKVGQGSGRPEEVDMITGATISSRTVIDIINLTIERWIPLWQEYEGAR
ncbi:MAG: FMN-binding protein [Gemmatimonadota bacterium]|nr:FMN-binding protein [Gemmatimonadota bacterium]